MNKALAYIRVSTEKQNMDLQRLEILDYCRKHNLKVADFIALEISSRKNNKLRRIDELLERLQPNDTLIVSELSRLGRSVGQVVNIVDDLIKNHIRLIAIKENMDIPPNGKKDLQTTCMTTLFSLFAEMERSLISERTKEALRAIRATGKKLGRPKGVKGKSKLDPYKEEVFALLNNGSTKTFVANRYNSTSVNLAHWLKQNKRDAAQC